MSNLLGIYDSKKSMTGLIKINADTYNEIPSQDILYLNGLTSNVQQQINTINTGISNGSLLPNITIGTVTDLANGIAPTVTRTGTNATPILNFGLERGANGTNGTNGTN